MAVLVITLSGSSFAALAANGTPAAGSPAATPTQNFTAKLTLSPSKAKIGDSITATGSGYPANASVDLVYHTVRGSYEIKKQSEYVGQQFDQTSLVLTTVTSDKDGNISAAFKVPSGFGGPHDIRGSVGGSEISQAGIIVQPTITMTPTEGPIGTPIELRIDGVDLRAKVNTWQLLYDNHYMGYASAVTTDGVAIARFRATGPVGTHLIQTWNNAYQSTPYLPWDTSPFRDDFPAGQTFTFTTTSDPGLIPQHEDDFSTTDNPWPVDASLPGVLKLSVDRGTVGQPTTLSGSKFPANSDITLTYITMVGDRVSDIGFSEMTVPLATVKSGSDGTFTYDMKIPDDLGGSHRIEASVGDKLTGVVGFVIMPSIVSMTTTPVHAGDEIEIHMKGIGWTTYDNAYTVSWDNSNFGYVCGFSTNGDVVFKILAVGSPGTHLIDMYPTIYQGVESKGTYWVPQLTYADDHPGRKLPAFQLSVEIVQ